MMNKLYRFIVRKVLSLRTRLRGYRFIKRGGLNQEIWGGGKFGERINSSIERWYSGSTEKRKQFLVYDMVDSYKRYGATPEEYFLMGFENMSHERRSQFLTIKVKDEALMKYIGYDLYCRDAKDKYRFACLAKDFFKRQVIRVCRDESIKTLNDFLNLNKEFIAKPLTGQCGKEVKIWRENEYKDAQELYEKLTDSGEWILEELIRQDETIGKWNPTSVNTVRMPSFYKNGVHKILTPVFRTGRLGMSIDNAAAGGVISSIDEQTGLLISNGFDELGHEYIVHPDSGLTFKGFQIPCWQDLLMIVEEVHKSMPSEHIYLGFDFALSDKGWVLIEANWGQFLSEFVLKTGIKSTFLSYLEG